MLGSIKRRLKDAATIKQVLLSAEASARAEGVAEPGSEHLVMAALALPDGTADRAFVRVGVRPADFRPAVARQYADALTRVGLGDGGNLLTWQEPPARLPRTRLFKSKPSAQWVIRRLVHARPSGSSRPLLGADFVLAALSSDVGTFARTLAVLEVEPNRLAEACRREIFDFEGRR